tara:strand:- start:784 stop:1377 length:594 start_codon:yes stop_codon:yes gene_type:complete
MRVLIACEYSAIVRDAFIAKGHDAWSCDLLETEGDPSKHIVGDALEVMYDEDGDGWDMMIAHPPCTFLANSGVRWLVNKDKSFNIDRYRKMGDASFFFHQLLHAPIRKIAIENPIQHKHCRLPKQDQVVQPWMFGENESKAVCLWLNNLPKLVPEVTEKPDNLEQRVWRMPPGPDRQKERSRFFKGIARAMAEQWGE